MYKIPLFCGKSYIRQTERFLDDRFREHKYACDLLQVTSNPAAHCLKCNCRAQFEAAPILTSSAEKQKREIIEAYFMGSGKHGACVNDPPAYRDEEKKNRMAQHLAAS